MHNRISLDTKRKSSPVPGLYADPDLTMWDGKYWLYPTTDGIEGWQTEVLHAFTSTDLKSWKDEGVIFRTSEDAPWVKNPLKTWAPAVLHTEDRHFLFYSGDGNIGCAVSDRPEGPFRDIGRPLVPGGVYDGYTIDPSVYSDVEGNHYLVWGNGMAHVAPFDPENIRIDETQMVSWSPKNFREALSLHCREGIYYAIWSVDDTRSPDYHLEYATAPSLAGPWKDHGVLLEPDPQAHMLGTGHHSAVQFKDSDEIILAYHSFAEDEGAGWRREIHFSALHYDDQGLLIPVAAAAPPYVRPL